MMPPKKRLVIGTLLYKSDLSILTRLVEGFFRLPADAPTNEAPRGASSEDDCDHSWDLSMVLWDNDNGQQLPQVQAHFKQVLSEDIQKRLHFHASCNIGFGKGHNALFEAYCANSDVDYYLCVNPDGIPHPELLSHFWEFTQHIENTGAPDGLYEARQFPVEHPKPYCPESGVTEWVSGCCLLVSKKVFQALNGFDPAFFMYMEDVDLSWRARFAGYQCYTVHNALFFHHKNLDPQETSSDQLQALNEMMWHAGYQLSEKYDLEPLKTQIWDQLRRHVDTEKRERIKADGLKQRHTKYAKLAKTISNIARGDTGFHFCEARW